MALTTHEKAMIDAAWNTGQLDEKNWGMFLERLRNEPDRKNAVQNALDMSGGRKWIRGLEKRRDILADPGKMGRLGEEFVEEHGGYGGAALEIGKQTITSIPQIIGSAAKVATFQDLGEDPLGEVISAAQIIPYGRMLAGLGRAGAQAAGRGVLASRLHHAATHPAVVNASRVSEVADVVGSENPLVEAAGEGAFEIGSTAIGHGLQGRRERRAADKMLEGKRQLGNISEVHPDTGDAVQGKRDREKSRRRRAYTFEQNGVQGRVDVERTGTGNKQWKVGVTFGDALTEAEYDKTEGVHSWETAFDEGLTLFVLEHPDLFPSEEITPDETVEETVETTPDTTETPGAETTGADTESETAPEVPQTPAEETVVETPTETEETAPVPPQVDMPDDLTDLAADEQMARLFESRETLMAWINENLDGEPTPELVAVLEQLGERMDALEGVLNEQEQVREAAEETEQAAPADLESLADEFVSTVGQNYPTRISLSESLRFDELVDTFLAEQGITLSAEQRTAFKETILDAIDAKGATDVEDTSAESDTPGGDEVETPEAGGQTPDTPDDGAGGSDPDVTETDLATPTDGEGGEVDGEETIDETPTEGTPETARTPTDSPAAAAASGEPAPISAEAPTPEGRLAFQMLERLRRGEATTIEEFYELADTAWGGTRSEGTYSEPEAYNVMEMAGNLFILEQMQENRQGDGIAVTTDAAKSQAAAIRDFVEQNLPRQDMRDPERDEFQQYSTPFSYGYVLNWVADVRGDDVVLEPSAGTGNIAIYGKVVDAQVVVNELADRRAKLLEMMGFDPVFRHNAEQIDNLLPPDIKPTVVVMNPPFSASAGRLSDNDNEIGGNHVLHALRRLEPGGRLVAIVGGGINPEGRQKGGMRTDSKGYRKFWEEAHERASLRANIHVDGAVYSRFGTPFDTRVLVFDKPVEGETASKEGWLDRNVTSVEDLIDALEEVRNARQRATPPQGGRPGESDTRGEPTNRTPSERATGTGTSTGDPGGRAEGADVSGSGDGRIPTGDRAVGGGGDTTTGASDEAVDPEAGDELPVDTEGQPTGLDRPDTPPEEGEQPAASDRPTGGDATDATGERPRPRAESESTADTDTETVVEEDPDAIFREHKPTAATMPENIKPHRGELDEPLVMADVPLPEATYTPDLPPEAIENGMISDAQMLPIIYAGQAFEQFFTGTQGRVRAGFFDGDGTGVGKSHIIAGIIADNFRRGGKKAVWFGPSKNFFKDGQNAWRLVTGEKKRVFQVNSTPTHEAIQRKDGILFSTYSTLIGTSRKVPGKTRLQQIQDWLGPDFDGVIAFDEAHYMKSAIQIRGRRGTQEPSQRAIAGMALARAFPNARVVYASATGATDIINMAYLDRLNLWGPETAFPSKEAFVSAISDGGLAAMEIVARDMKAKGKYVRRQLSSRGLTYEQIEHKMDAEQVDVYNNVAAMWRETLLALEETNMRSGVAGNQLQTFWNKHQDFFNRVLTSISMPTLIPFIQEQKDAGNAVVLQITSTNQATMDRQMADREEEETLEDVELSSKEILENFLRENFPVEAYQTVQDADGNETQEMVRDDNGEPVVDREAAARRDALLERLFDLHVPEGALDQIIQHFGDSQVAEVTSRKDRIVVDDDGNRAVQRRPNSESEVDAFMDDKKQILVFSRAGGTGASYHADNKRANKRKRIHVLVEPGWQADVAIQGLGRTHRTDQASDPHYAFVQTEVPGQRRFVASVIRKFDQVGALTGGERRTTSGGLLSPDDNIDNEYGERAVHRLIRAVGEGRRTLRIPGFDGGQEIEIGLPGLELLLGKRMRNQDGRFTSTRIPDIRQFLNRVLGMRIDQQAVMYEYFEEELRGVIEQAIEDDEFDFGTEMIQHDGAEAISSQSIYRDEETGTDTNLETLKVRESVKKESIDRFRGSQSLLRFIRTDRGRIWAEMQHRSRIDERGRTTEMVMRVGPTSQRPMPRHESEQALRNNRATEIAREVTPEVELAWQQESDRSPGFEEKFMYLVTGALLPIWDRLPNPNNPKVYRIQLDDGTNRLGRVMEEENLPQIEQNFAIQLNEGAITAVDRQYTSAEDVMGAVVDNGLRLELTNRWVLRMSTIDRAERFEVEGPGHLDRETVEGMGITRIRQRSRNRFVIHFDGREAETIGRLIERFPVVAEVQGRRRQGVGGDTPQGTPETPPETPDTPPETPESPPAAQGGEPEGRVWSNEEETEIAREVASRRQERAAEQEQQAEPPSEEATPPAPQPETTEISDEVAHRFWRMNFARSRNSFIDARSASLSRDEGIAEAKEILGAIKAIPLEQRRQMVMADSWEREGRSGKFNLVQDGENNGLITITASRASVTLRNPSIQNASVRAPGPNYGERFSAVLNELQSYLLMPEALEGQVSASGAVTPAEPEATPTKEILEGRALTEAVEEHPALKALGSEDGEFLLQDLPEAYDIRNDIDVAAYVHQQSDPDYDLTPEQRTILKIIRELFNLEWARGVDYQGLSATDRRDYDKGQEIFTHFAQNYERGVKGEVQGTQPEVDRYTVDPPPEVEFQGEDAWTRGGITQEGQLSFVQDALKLEVIQNAYRLTNAFGRRVDPDNLPDISGGVDVSDIPKRVRREAVVKLPRQNIKTEGKGRRGTGRGLDAIRQTFISWFPVLAEKMGAWTPQLRQRFRQGKSEFMSGVGNLYKMGEPGRELYEALRGRVRVANYLTNMFRADFEPLMVEFDKFSKERHKGDTEGTSLKDVQGEMEERIWRFIEKNEQILNDTELHQIAVKWKEAWRDMVKTNIKLMISLQTSLEEQGQSLDIIDTKRQRKAWRPIMEEFGWSQSKKMFTQGRGRNIKYFTIDQALAQATKIWTPHIYEAEHWENRVEEAEARRAELDALPKDEVNIPGFQYVSDRTDPDAEPIWIWQAGSNRRQFTERDKAIAYAKRQVNNSRRAAASQLEAIREGNAREGHLEMARETNDQFYTRRLGLLQIMQMRFADRMGELHVFGQYDPEQGNHGGSPFLREYLKNIREYAENPEELALREFTRPLLAHSKFKALKGFSVSKPYEALGKLRRWEMDTLIQSDSPTKAQREKAWDALERTGGIDPNRVFEDNDAITDEMKATLVKMGLIRQEIDGNFSMTNNTKIARILGEYFDTISLRENTAVRIVNGLVPKTSFDPVDMQGMDFWRTMNDATTILTLGPTASIQNIAEMPILTLMTGSKAMARGTKDFISDPDFQEAGKFLGTAIGTTREYLAEGGQHAFTWLGKIGFNKTDWLGRGAGTVAGTYRVQDDIRAYVEDASDIHRGRLEDNQINVDVIDGYIEAGGTVERLDSIFEEFNERYKMGLVPVEGIRIQEGDAAVDEYTDILGDEIGKGAAHISDSAFKQYNALSLNSLLAQRDPHLRVFLKYQAWSYQQSSLIYRQTKQAFRRAAQGDFRSTMWLVTTMGSLVGTYTALRWVYDALQDRDDKEVKDRLIDAFAEAQVAGYISVIMEIVRRAQGSTFSALNSIMFQLSPPLGTFLGRPAAEAMAEGPGAGVRQAIKQLPGPREVRRFGGRILPEDWR